jgi:diaminohydroxyphosphoribosylaminopyrimidine deaminase/5-amino-6-(5-phosphoribosylamino)uracil reductase
MSYKNLLPVPPSRSNAHTPCRTGPEDDPCAAIRDAPADRPFVVAQLGQSLDGRIATPSGESRWINRQAALDHVHRLRAAVDGVVVGIGTVLADDPLLNVRRVAGRNPARVVIDPMGRLPAQARCLSEDGVQRFVVRATDAPAPDGVEVVRLSCERRTLAPGAIVTALFDLGLRRLLIEGGAHTVSRFIDAEAVDRLHVLVAPMILGCGKMGLELSPIAKLSEARRPRTRVHLLEDGDVLFDCDLRAGHRGV